ncbi:MAG: (Fe-S)-binding protein [Clostridium sp.]
MKKVFAPGCALMIYKPELGRKVMGFLNNDLGNIDEHLICCRHNPNLDNGTQIINTCAGCDRRYRELYAGITTISLWEVLAKSTTFPFPNYKGCKMAILDACPTRNEERVQSAVRVLLERMNIIVIEPEKTRTEGTCCGDSFYGALPVAQVKEQMKKRANEMPADNVVVYCVSCSKSMYIGGKKPRYLVDLLFGEDTIVDSFEPDDWHGQLDKFINEH